MIVRVNGPLGGQVTPPPSKSAAHRALICAALSDRPCTIRCDMVNDDMAGQRPEPVFQHPE